MITQKQLQEELHYDPDTGMFTWLVQKSNRVYVGRVALPNGRRRVTLRIDHHTYAASRLAFLYMNGAMPSGVIDHIDGDTTNNRWNNLRDVPQRVNTQNIRHPHSDNKTGFQGVVRKPSGKFAANIFIDGRQTSLGLYETAEAANAVYVRTKRLRHEGCTI